MKSASAAFVNDRCFAAALKTWSLRSDTRATALQVAALHCGTELIILVLPCALATHRDVPLVRAM
jgi:hypothetical protein